MDKDIVNQEMQNAIEVTQEFYRMNKAINDMLQSKGVFLNEIPSEEYTHAVLEGAMSADVRKLALHALGQTKADRLNDHSKEQALEAARKVIAEVEK